MQDICASLQDSRLLLLAIWRRKMTFVGYGKRQWETQMQSSWKIIMIFWGMFTRYYCELWVHFWWTLQNISYSNCCRLEFAITGSAITWGVPSFQNSFQCFWWQDQGLLFFHTQVLLPHILMWWVMWIFFAISTITSFTHSAMQIISASSWMKILLIEHG
jgi:hypothetical protein